MELSSQILSDITVFSKYARYLPDQRRRETWEEIVSRNKEMHKKRFPKLASEIDTVWELVRQKKVLPSARALQFGGRPIELNLSRSYNCSFLPIDSWEAFHEIMFLLLGGTGVGWALALDTPVPTPEGWCKMGDLSVGDKVFDEAGEPTTIIDVSPIYMNHKVFEVQFADGQTIKADENHLWTIQTRSQRARGEYRSGQNTRTVTTRELRVGNSIKVAGPLHLPDAALPLDPYIFGYWLGDGTTKNAIISTGDDFIIEEFSRLGFRCKPLRRYDYYVGNLYSGLHQLGFLRKRGGHTLSDGTKVPRTVSGRKHIPVQYLRGSFQQRLALLQGLMDSDGTCSKKGQCVFSVNNRTLAEQTRELCCTLGLKPVLRPRLLEGREMYGVSFSTDLPVFRLPRKLARLRPHNLEVTRRHIRNIHPIPSEPVRCITVAAPSHLYLVGDTFIATHNSVQRHHIARLPELKMPNPKRTRRFLVNDSIEGWADAIKGLMKNYFMGGSTLEFDFSDIRPRGSPLVTAGGRAPGPQPLKDCIHNLRKILDTKSPGDRLTPLEAHDIGCFIADCVLAGGIRRSACISLFSIDDEDMLACKTGHWAELSPQRARANNSAVILRHRIRERRFLEFWERVKAGGTGEPGLILSNNQEWGFNPCQPSWATLLTPSGIRRVKDTKIGDRIWCGHEFTRVIAKRSTGVKPVHEYHTRAGVFIGTENHRVLTRGEKIEAEDADAIDTCRGNGNRGTSQYHCQDSEATSRYIMDGLVLGDGTVHKASNGLVGLLIGSADGDYFTSEIRDLIKEHRPGITQEFYTVCTSIKADELPKTYERKVPKRYFEAELNISRFFLRGLYSANGSVVRGRVTLKAASRQMILDVQQMLSALGIRSYYTVNKEHDVEFSNGTYTCKESYDLNISTDAWLFKDLIGFIQKDKQEKLAKIADPHRDDRAKTTYEVVERVSCGEHEVFSFTVEHDCHNYWTGGLHVSNCGEASLRPYSFCNLTTVNTADIESQADLETRSRAAAFIGTLQASYTDFHYLREIWRETTEKDALLGVGLAGIASGAVLRYDLKRAAAAVLEENKRVARLIGIRPTARATLVKPDGTVSLVLGTSSGIHAWHAPYYIRRIRLLKNEPLYRYLKRVLPSLVEDEYYKPSTEAVLSIPIKAPDGAICRSEGPISLLKRVERVYNDWVLPGHVDGDNTHNISATVSIQEYEWDKVGRWMWEHRDSYTCLAVLPHTGGNYRQLPHEEIDEETYTRMEKNARLLDLAKVSEEEDLTTLTHQVACAGDACALD